ncbi:MAG TPA: phosphate acyltransferase, partial [Mesotoga infera]|nr:phosphate acyltransferase [Mesotoga infera]
MVDMKNFSDLIRLAKGREPKRVVLIGSEDREGVKALKLAVEEGIALPIFVGDEKRTSQILSEEGLEIEVIPASSSDEACEK